MWKIAVSLGLLALVQAVPPCIQYCNITPNNRTLCPETPETRPLNRVDTTAHLAALRSAMTNNLQTGHGNISAYLVFESSYYGGGVTDHDRRMKWISGYSGSAGYVIVSTSRASLWTDGRYFLQGDQQLDCNWNLMKQGVAGYPNGSDWLKDILTSGDKVGAHPGSMAASTWQTYEAELARVGVSLVEVPQDLFDHIWTTDRPPKPNNLIYVYEMKYAGRTWQDKISEVRPHLVNTADVILLTVLDDIAWLFNLRGWDRANSPLFDSAAIVRDTEITLYLNNYTVLLQDGINTHLNTKPDGTCTGQSELCVQVRELSTLISDITSINSLRIWIDSAIGYDIYKATGSNRVVAATPVALIKSQKNVVERDNYKKCQLRDSATMVEFMTLIEKEVVEGVQWTEMTASAKLKEMRSLDVNYKMLSFETIAGSGPNGAVIHYRATPETDRPLTMDEVFLLDSGGNYLDGTTDITRTFYFGENPPDKVKEAYTRVLMGAIDLADTVWPQGWKGSDLDARTRVPLWQNGWDYNHGTGHGIGMFLNVHEDPSQIGLGHRSLEESLLPGMFLSDGPGRINIGYNPDHAPLYPGMFFSDEPGFYEDGDFGVRLETIVEVVKANVPNNFNSKEYLTFYPHTVVPFEPKMIDVDMLETHHRKWLNMYNARCLEETGKYLKDTAQNQAAYDWIVARTAHIPDTPNWADVVGSADFTSPSVSAVMVTVMLVFWCSMK